MLKLIRTILELRKFIGFLLIVFQSILKRNIWTITQGTAIASAMVLGFSQAAQAEDIKTHETLQVSCNPFSESTSVHCDSLGIETEEEKIAQRRGRKRKSKVDGYYGGVTLGVGFGSGEIDLGDDIAEADLQDPDYSTSFLISFFEGIKFNKNLSADLEFLLAFGGTNSDDFDDGFNELAQGIGVAANLETESSYSTFALYLNPRFELPLAKRGKFNIYISPGIGISQTNVSFDLTSDLPDFEDSNTDASDTGFTFQVKGGASLAVTNSIQVVAQARYLTLPTDKGFDDINIFGLDAGVKLNF